MTTRAEITPQPQAPADPPAAPAAEPAERPEWLPEQFKTPEDLAKSYTELRAKMSAGDPAAEETPPAGEPTETPAETPAASAPYTSEELSTWSEAYEAEGAVPEEAYETLAKRGFAREDVDAFLAGKQAIQAKQSEQLLSLVGGGDAYNAQIEWAAGALEPAEIEAFNNTVNTGTFDEVKAAITGLHKAYTEANPKSPVNMMGDRGGAGSGGYRTQSEMLTAQRDKRYWSDPDYRRSVEDKIARSTF